jgi:hypothetical protein
MVKPGFKSKKLFKSILFLFLLIPACAEVRFQTIAAPPPTAKLRVLVQPISGNGPPGGWRASHENWAMMQTRNVEGILEQSGVYELPKPQEIRQVLGNRQISWSEWKRNDWAVAREAGQAIHADYSLIVERAFSEGIRYFDALLINVETGRRFAVSLRVPLRPEAQEDWRRINRVACRELFQDAKGDMVATAMRKGQTLVSGVGPTPQPPPVPPTVPSPSSGPKVPPEVTSSAPVRQIDLEKALRAESETQGRPRLVVYDLEAVDSLKIAALIFSEALREELSRMGFTLVNRENITKLLEEMAFQKTGVVDEQQAVQLGKGLAATQIVMGRFATLGKMAVLQAKRIDIQTQGTLALGSLNCPLGKEEDLIARMPELARKLIETASK